MKTFKQLKNLGYKHYIDLTIEEIDKLSTDNIEKRIECYLVIDWFRIHYNIIIEIKSWKGYDNDWYYMIHDNGVLLPWSFIPNKSYEVIREQAILKAIKLCQTKSK